MHRVAVLLLGVALLAPALAVSTTDAERRVQRLVGSPTPLGPVRALSDRAAWEITLDPATIVWIEASAPPHSTFYLTTDCTGTLILPPSHVDGRLCSKPGTWRVEVDPAGGVAVDITVRFAGRVGDLSGAPRPFLLKDLEVDRPCVVPGVCLP